MDQSQGSRVLMNADERFKKIEALFLSRGFEFDHLMKFKYFHDPMVHALCNLVLEAFENIDHIGNWDPWEE